MPASFFFKKSCVFLFFNISHLYNSTNFVNFVFIERNFNFSGQRIVEQYQKQLSDENERRESAQRDLKRSSDVLIQCKAGVEHLSEKLAHIKVTCIFLTLIFIFQQIHKLLFHLCRPPRDTRHKPRSANKPMNTCWICLENARRNW